MIVLASDRSHGGAKLAWSILALPFGWLLLLVWLIVTQKSADAGRASRQACPRCGKRSSGNVCLSCGATRLNVGRQAAHVGPVAPGDRGRAGSHGDAGAGGGFQGQDLRG